MLEVIRLPACGQHTAVCVCVLYVRVSNATRGRGTHSTEYACLLSWWLSLSLSTLVVSLPLLVMLPSWCELSVIHLHQGRQTHTVEPREYGSRECAQEYLVLGAHYRLVGRTMSNTFWLCVCVCVSSMLKTSKERRLDTSRTRDNIGGKEPCALPNCVPMLMIMNCAEWTRNVLNALLITMPLSNPISALD